MKHWKRKDISLLGNRLIEKVPDLSNAKRHYQSFFKEKNRKSVKQSEIITYIPKPFENPNIVDIKSVITEHWKIFHKLSKTKKGKSDKVGSNSSLYSDTEKMIFSLWIKI